jgi:hypothetical protein
MAVFISFFPVRFFPAAPQFEQQLMFSLPHQLNLHSFLSLFFD